MTVRENDDLEPIAIVGLGCRLPGAANPRALWDLLLNRGDAVGVLDPASSNGRAISERRTIRGGFLEHIDRFDAKFFGISPREAERLDPQQRILLEVAWEALEDAGLAADRLSGSATGVFVGMWINDYESRMFSESAKVDFHMTTGSGRYTASGRLSNLLDLRGPSLTIDTACSSSLVAVHLACQSLSSGEIPLAIVGGVNVILQPHISAAYSQAGMLSQDGHCKFGDTRADGYVRSEGAGVVVLKRLGRAREDKDPIHAVILGTAANNDGRTGRSLGSPGRAGQEDLLRTAYRRAGVAPAAVQYIEAHGTGTRAGDPVELAALGTVLGAGRDASRPCFVGSVKTNIGHTEGAAGLAGLIKVALSLEHRTIPASLHFETPTPDVAWEDLPLVVPTEALAWPETDRPVAGVSSFGIGGTNAHAVLAAAPSDAPSPAVDRAERESLLVLSARSSQALRGLAEGYWEHLARPDVTALSDICYTAAVRRSHHEHRLAVVGRHPQEITARLQSFLKSPAPGLVQARAEGRSPRVAFVFPGQGSQWVGMGRRLAEKEPTFRKALERCASAVAAHGGPALIEELNADDPSRLERIDVVQPALFAIQVALAELWREWGVEPVAVVGHSMGEVAAAHIAGALTLDDAARVISTRSALLRRISGRGAMAMVELSPDELGAVLRGREDQVSIAVCNSERSTVVAGDVTALNELVKQLELDGVFCRRVKVDVASHSSQVDPLREDLLRALVALAPVSNRVPMYSTVTAKPIDGARLDAAYWMRNLRETVQFAGAIRRLREDGCDAFVEISPNPILVPAIEQAFGDGRPGLCLPSLRRKESERAVMLESLGALYTAGHPVEWARLHPAGGRCVSLPPYPWEREQFWFPAAPEGGGRRLAAGSHPLLQEHVASSADAGTHFWQGRLDPAQLPWLLEHRVHGMAVFPASAMIEMALTAAETVFVGARASVEDVRLDSPLAVGTGAPRTLQLVVSASWPGVARFRLASRGPEGESSGPWVVHATGVIRRDEATEVATVPMMPAPEAMDAVTSEMHYEAMHRRGLDYGPAFQGVVTTSRSGAVIDARLRATDAVNEETGRYAIHPCLLDSALQCVIAALDDTRSAATTTYVPSAVGRAVLFGRPPVGEGLQCRVTVRRESAGDEVVADVVLADDQGRVVAEVTGVRVVPLAGAADTDLESLLFETQWRRAPAPASARSDSPGRWMILADHGGVGEALARRLASRGALCSLVFSRAGAPANASTQAGPAIDIESVGEYQRMLGEGTAEPLHGVVYLWGLDVAPLAPGVAGPITESPAVQSLVNLVKALVGSESSGRPRVVLATAGVQDIAETAERVAVEQAALWGTGAVVANEHPDLRCTRVDLSAESNAEEIEGLARECTEPDGEGQIALRGTDRYVARLVRVVPDPEQAADETPAAPADTMPFRVHASSVGTLDGLRLRPLARRAPGPGEIEIEVRAAGLNFMDVMSALGSLPGHPNGTGPIGIEYAGRVVGVGTGVETPRLGDEVIAIAFDYIGTHVVADARLTVPKPPHLDHATAATLPIAFLTAAYALENLAGMRAGDRVLIHAAAGGVGMAGVRLAQRAGATVFATAGSPRKREFLRSLGVEHVLDSRSLSFAKDVKAITDGAGVDIVLNSLAGEAVAAGLATLAPYGRFVELGKRDIYQNAPLGLGPFRNNLSYAALDLELMCHERPAVVGALLADLMKRVVAGEVEPLPVRVFPIGEVTEAFRFMAEARHIGKIALSVSPEDARVAPLTRKRAAIRPDATYLITGGLGALGLALAGALVDAGARHVSLLGRRVPDGGARRAIADLERRGAQVLAVQADVAVPEEMARALDELRSRMPPLRGIIHAAGVLNDATLLRMERTHIRAVMAPKATGAWMLHTLTEQDPLDFFVLCSSASAFLGLAGQANYAGANAFLDALARSRRRLGRPAVSIGWGPWSDIGLAAASHDRGARLEGLGLGSLAPEDAVAAFRVALESRRAHVAVMAFDAPAWSAQRDGKPDPFVSDLLDPVAAPAASGLPDTLRAAPVAARLAILQEHLTARVARILRLEPARVDLEAPLKSLGLDSLMALELRNRLEADFGLRLSATLVWNYPTISALAGHIVETLGLAADPEAADRSVERSEGEVAGVSDDLSREQVGALLSEELERVNRLLDSQAGTGP